MLQKWYVGFEPTHKYDDHNKNSESHTREANSLEVLEDTRAHCLAQRKPRFSTHFEPCIAISLDGWEFLNDNATNMRLNAMLRFSNDDDDDFDDDDSDNDKDDTAIDVAIADEKYRMRSKIAESRAER
jgi:hypothetical protein